MSLTLVSPPDQRVLEPGEALEHLRELDTTQAGYVTGLIAAAEAWVEQYCRRALLTQTWQLVRDTWPACEGFLRLPRAPLQSVTSVKYVALDGTLTTWGSSNYTVDTASTPGRVHAGYLVSWPTLRSVPNAVEVTYVAGYGDEGRDVPEPIRHALKLLVGHWYNLREPVITGTIVTKVPLSVESLLGPYRVLEF